MYRRGLCLSQHATRFLLPSSSPIVFSIRCASTSSGRHSKTEPVNSKSNKLKENIKSTNTKTVPKEETKEKEIKRETKSTKGIKETKEPEIKPKAKEEKVATKKQTNNLPTKNAKTKETPVETKQTKKEEKVSQKSKSKTPDEIIQEVDREIGREIEVDNLEKEIEEIERKLEKKERENEREAVTEVHKEKQTQKKIILKENEDRMEVVTTTTTTETTTTTISQQQQQQQQQQIQQQQQQQQQQKQKQIQQSENGTKKDEPRELTPAEQALVQARQVLEGKPVDYKKAIQYYARALKLYHADKNIQMICETLLAISKAQSCDKQYAQSFSTLKDLAQFSKQVSRPDMESLSMTMMGTIMSQFNKGEEQSKAFLEMGLQLANQPPTKYCKQESMNVAKRAALEALGNYEKIISNDPEKAEEYFKEGLQLAEEDDDLEAKLRFQAELLLEEEEEEAEEVTYEDPDIEESKE